MANFELQIEVAMALGWDGFWYAPGVTFAWPPGATIEDDRMPLPDWPNDWNAAMELVKIIMDAGYFVKITSPFNPGEPWGVKIDQMGWGDSNPPLPGGYWRDPEGQPAICKAFLGWKGEQDGKES